VVAERSKNEVTSIPLTPPLLSQKSCARHGTMADEHEEEEPVYDEEGGDDDVEAMRRRVEEMEQEALQIQALQDNVQKEVRH